MKKFNSYFGNKIVIVIKKLSVIIIYIIKVVKYCVWLGYGKMGVLLYYLINKNGGGGGKLVLLSVYLG